MGNCLSDVMAVNAPVAALSGSEDWSDWTDNKRIRRGYKVKEHLGSGSFAEVVSAIHKSSKRKVAIKIVHLKRPGLTSTVLNILHKEAEMLKAVQGTQGVVKLYDVEKDERHLFIVHELCAGGELYDFLASLKTFDETRAADLFRLIAEAVQGIHDHGFLHRDIKPENILFVGAPAHVAKSRADFVDLGDKWVSPRIIDLGMADQYDPRAPTIGICGSPGFIAPEVLKGEQHSPKMDVYSLGVLLFMMLTGKVPYGEELSAECKYGSVPLGSAKHWIDGTTDPLSHNARSLLARMLEPRPTRRISLKEVLAHQWLQPGGQGDAVLRYGHVLRHATTLRRKNGLDACLCDFGEECERAAGANEWRPLGDAKKPSKVGGNEAVGKNIQNDHQQRMQRSETMKQRLERKKGWFRR